MDEWGYSYLIEEKTLWEKEKLLVTSNFSFSYNVFKSCLLLMRKNKYLWSKGLSAVMFDIMCHRYALNPPPPFGRVWHKFILTTPLLTSGYKPVLRANSLSLVMVLCFYEKTMVCSQSFNTKTFSRRNTIIL